MYRRSILEETWLGEVQAQELRFVQLKLLMFCFVSELLSLDVKGIAVRWETLITSVACDVTSMLQSQRKFHFESHFFDQKVVRTLNALMNSFKLRLTLPQQLEAFVAIDKSTVINWTRLNCFTIGVTKQNQSVIVVKQEESLFMPFVNVLELAVLIWWTKRNAWRCDSYF